MNKKVRDVKVEESVLLGDIHIGRVVQVREYHEKGTNGETIRHFKNLDVRKIVFMLIDDNGIDLSRKLLGNDKYTYKVMNLDDEKTKDKLKHNTLVITDAIKVDQILRLAGFPDVVRGGEIKTVAKLLLSKEQELKIKKHSMNLNGGPIFDCKTVVEVNREAVELYNFKTCDLPTKPQPKEKAYKKYFR